jgi:hypothetical protein
VKLSGKRIAENGSPTKGTEEFESALPRCSKMDGSTLRFVPSYTEAGWFVEANCVTITDGERTAVYVPFAITADCSEDCEASTRATLQP